MPHGMIQSVAVDTREGPVKKPKVIVTEDRSSHRRHRRLVFAGNMYVDERCNLDQAGEYDETDEPGPLHDPKLLCQNCFPERFDAT